MSNINEHAEDAVARPRVLSPRPVQGQDQTSAPAQPADASVSGPRRGRIHTEPSSLLNQFTPEIQTYYDCRMTYDKRLYAEESGQDFNRPGFVPPSRWLGHHDGFGDTDEEEYAPIPAPKYRPRHYTERESLPAPNITYVERFARTPAELRGPRRQTIHRIGTEGANAGRVRNGRSYHHARPSTTTPLPQDEYDWSLFQREGWNETSTLFYSPAATDPWQHPEIVRQYVWGQHGQQVNTIEIHVSTQPLAGWYCQREYHEPNADFNGGWLRMIPEAEAALAARPKRFRWLPLGLNTMSPEPEFIQAGTGGIQGQFAYAEPPPMNLDSVIAAATGVGEEHAAGGDNGGEDVQMTSGYEADREEEEEQSRAPTEPAALRRAGSVRGRGRMLNIPAGAFNPSYGPVDPGHVAHHAPTWRAMHQRHRSSGGRGRGGR